MARHARRLITWIGGGILALALLVVLAVLALVWLVNPNSYRARIAQSASNAIGRPVQLGGDLHWNIGWQIAIESEGGSVGNAPGFDATPFARWRRLQLGLDTRALLGKRIVIDRLDVEGLEVNLQQDAAGEGNWKFTSATPAAGAAATKPTSLQVAALHLADSQVTFRNANARWRLGGFALDVKLPADLNSQVREVRDLSLHGRLMGGPLPEVGVPVSIEAGSVKHDASTSTLDLPAFEARWDEAVISGAAHAVLGEPLAAQGNIALRVPSVRALLASIDVTPPPMADPETLGKLEVDANFNLEGEALAATELRMTLDDTSLAGSISTTSLAPLALKFDLAGDSIDLDRYLEPADHAGKPLELPLAQLKALNVQGVLKLKSASVAGAKATELRIDVE